MVGCCLYPAYDWDMQGRKQERTCVPVVGHILHAILKTGALHIALGNEPDRSGVHACQWPQWDGSGTVDAST